MRGQYVTASITGPDQWTPALPVERGPAVAFSLAAQGFAGTVTLQRSLDGSTWSDVQQWVDTGVEGSYDVDVPQQLRAGVKTGDFILGQVVVRIEQ